VSVSVGQRSVSLKKRNTSGTQATIEVWSKQRDNCWISKRRVACDVTMWKSTLLELVEANKPKHKVYRVDQLLKQHVHKSFV
jgi:hypothetical protein